MDTTATDDVDKANLKHQDHDNCQTAAEFIDEQLQLEKDARQALPYTFDKCTQPLGAQRQELFSCLTCNPPPASPTDVYKPAGICYACSIACHSQHHIVELFVKRGFVCDCGTTRMPSTARCALRINPTTGLKGGCHSEDPAPGNKYNQNFQNRYCSCGVEYNADTEDGTMYQCLGLGDVDSGGCGEDWWHPDCLMGSQPSCTKIEKRADGDTSHETKSAADSLDDSPPPPPGFPDEDSFDMPICWKCVEAFPWIKRYAGTEGFLPPVFRDAADRVNQAAEEAAADVIKMPAVSDAVVEEHEKLARSGYPKRKADEAETVGPVASSSSTKRFKAAEEVVMEQSALSTKEIRVAEEVVMEESTPSGREIKATEEVLIDFSSPSTKEVKVAEELAMEESTSSTRVIKAAEEVVMGESTPSTKEIKVAEEVVMEGSTSPTKGIKATEAEVIEPSSHSASNDGPKCKYVSLPEAPKGTFSLFVKSNFRKHLCRCANCFPNLAPHVGLLDVEETYEPPLSEDEEDAEDTMVHSDAGTGSLLDRGERALSNVDRVRAIEGVMIYNDLKDKVKAFLKPFAETGEPVGAEHIKEYFEKLRGDDEALKDAKASAVATKSTRHDNDDDRGGSNHDHRQEQGGY